jgi:hypothetical protein
MDAETARTKGDMKCLDTARYLTNNEITEHG